MDFDHLGSNLEKWNSEPLSGYVLGGSNGEYAYLTEDERVECVRVARQTIPRNRLLIAGSAMESTRATINLTQRMATAGADIAIIVTPNYYKARMTARRDGASLQTSGRHFTDPDDALQRSGEYRLRTSGASGDQSRYTPEHHWHEGERRRHYQDRFHGE